MTELRTMIPDELEAEWNYRHTERLGIMCGVDQPTIEQEEIARAEATEAIEKLTKLRFE